MKKEFGDYLESIGLTDVIIKRIEVVYQFYEKTLGKLDDEIQDIFVTDYISKDGMRQYENLWFFGKNYFMEAKLFLNQDDFDISPSAKKIDWIQVKKQDYDFVKANEKSRLYVNLLFLSKAGTASFKASEDNCDYLKEIYLKHMLSNLRL